MSETIREIQIGETKIYISDKYCQDVSPEEGQKALDEFAARSLRYLQEKSV